MSWIFLRTECESLYESWQLGVNQVQFWFENEFKSMWKGYIYACAHIKKQRPRCSSLPKCHITAWYTTTFHLHPQGKYDPPCVNFHRTHKGSTSLCAEVFMSYMRGEVKEVDMKHLMNIYTEMALKWSIDVKGHSSSMYCKNNASR